MSFSSGGPGSGKGGRPLRQHGCSFVTDAAPGCPLEQLRPDVKCSLLSELQGDMFLPGPKGPGCLDPGPSVTMHLCPLLLWMAPAGGLLFVMQAGYWGGRQISVSVKSLPRACLVRSRLRVWVLKAHLKRQPVFYAQHVMDEGVCVCGGVASAACPFTPRPPASFPPLFTHFCSAPGPTRVLLGSQSEAGSTSHHQPLSPRGGIENGGCRSMKSPLCYAHVVPASAAPGLCPEGDMCSRGE